MATPQKKLKHAAPQGGVKKPTGAAGRPKRISAAEVPVAKMPLWLRFMAPVVPQTVNPLLQCIDRGIATGADHIHLMLSSPGGSVFHGLSLHNYLRGIGVPVTTYNFGSVDSIGVVIFCAGSERVCVPHARFLIHGVTLNFNAQQRADEKQIEEHLKGIKIDAANIARVVADATGRQLEQVEQDMLDRTTLNPQQAKDYGLVTRVEKDLYQSGTFFAIYEDGQVFQSSAGMEQLQRETASQANVTGGPSNSTLPEDYPLPR